MVLTKHIAHVFLLLLAINVSSPVWIKGYFEANRAEIAAAHCVNKAKPELKCNGQCHLKKMLTPADDTGKDAPSVTYSFSDEYISGTQPMEFFVAVFSEKCFFGDPVISTYPLFAFSVFHPPIV